MTDKNVEGKQVFVISYKLRRVAVAWMSIPLLLVATAIFTVPFLGAVMRNMWLAALVSVFGFITSLIFIFFWAQNPDYRRQVGWRKSFQEMFAFKWPGKTNAFISLAVGVFMFGLLQAVSWMLKTFGLSLESSQSSVLMGQQQGFSLIFLVAIFAPFFAPVLEELFFRGTVLNFLSHKGSVFAITVSSLFFAVMHIQGAATFGDLFVFLWTLLMGIVLGLVFVKTKSSVSSMLTHFGYNAVTSIAVLFPVLF